MNRTIMIHTIDGPIFCIGEELFRRILVTSEITDYDAIANEMVAKLIKNLDESPA